MTYSDTSKDDPDPVVAYAEYDRYLSQLDADYLKSLATEIGGQYIEGAGKPEFYDYVQQQKPAASFVTAYSVRWLFLLLAATLIVLTYAPNILFRYDFMRKTGARFNT